MKMQIAKLLLMVMSLVVGMSGCMMFRHTTEPDVVMWLSSGIPEEWVARQIESVGMKYGCLTNAVPVARQYNSYGMRDGKENGFWGHEEFLVVAAYNTRTGAFSAEWGYSPKPEAGHNRVQMIIDPQGANLAAIATCAAKHPVRYELDKDFSKLVMQWGHRFEGRGNFMHEASWTYVAPEKGKHE